MNIRTLEQTRGDRVTVQIEAPTGFFDDRTTVTISVPAPPSAEPLTVTTDADVMDLAERAAKVPALETSLSQAQERITELLLELDSCRKAHVCTVECRPNQHTAFQGRRRITELERQLAESRALVESKIKVVSSLRDQEQVYAIADARAEAHAAVELANEIREIVNRPGLDDYLEDHVQLGSVILQIRKILSSPTT
jgi:hypothetical protein